MFGWCCAHWPGHGVTLPGSLQRIPPQLNCSTFQHFNLLWMWGYCIDVFHLLLMSYNETSPAVQCGYPGPRGHGRLAGSWWPRSMLSCSVPVSDMSAMFSHVRNGDFQTCNTIMVNGQFDWETSLKPPIRKDLSRQSQLRMEKQLL